MRTPDYLLFIFTILGVRNLSAAIKVLYLTCTKNCYRDQGSRFKKKRRINMC